MMNLRLGGDSYWIWVYNSMDNSDFVKKFKGKFQLAHGGIDLGVHFVKKRISGVKGVEGGGVGYDNRTTSNHLKNNTSEGNVKPSPSLASIKLPAIKNVKRQYIEKDIKPMNERHHLSPYYVKKTGSSLSYLPKKLNMHHDATSDIKVNRSYQS